MKSINNNEAVSPVVGVMLMLVVTLIIAGVVSAFGGGLVSTTSATPQASITSALTYDDSLKLTHNGGSSIIGTAFDVKAKIASGSNVDMISNVNLTGAKLPRTGQDVAKGSFQPGDVLTIAWDHVFTGYFPSKNDLVTITILDKNSGKQIASQTVQVN